MTSDQRRIRPLREDLAWSVFDLARHAGLAARRVFELETGRGAPATELELRALGRALGVPMLAAATDRRTA